LDGTAKDRTPGLRRVGTGLKQGRAGLTIERLSALPVLDARELDQSQLTACRAIFDDLEARSFLPANEAYRDPARQELDRRLADVLNLDAELLDELTVLRQQWCAEPSVHGGKKTKPKTN